MLQGNTQQQGQQGVQEEPIQPVPRYFEEQPDLSLSVDQEPVSLNTARWQHFKRDFTAGESLLGNLKARSLNVENDIKGKVLGFLLSHRLTRTLGTAASTFLTPPENFLSNEQYEKSQYQRPGLKFPNGVYENVAALEAKHFDDKQIFKDLESRSDQSTWANFTKGAAGFAGGIANPLFLLLGGAVGEAVAPAAGFLSDFIPEIKALSPEANATIKGFGRSAGIGGAVMPVFTGLDYAEERANQEDASIRNILYSIPIGMGFGVGGEALSRFLSSRSARLTSDFAKKEGLNIFKPSLTEREKLIVEAQRFETHIEMKKTLGIVPHWGTKNQFLERNPFFEQIKKMKKTKKFDKKIIDESERWEMRQVLLDKPAYFSSGLPNEELKNFAKQNPGIVFSEERGGIVAQNTEALNKLVEAKNQREIGLALGYKDIGIFGGGKVRKGMQEFKEFFEKAKKEGTDVIKLKSKEPKPLVQKPVISPGSHETMLTTAVSQMENGKTPEISEIAKQNYHDDWQKDLGNKLREEPETYAKELEDLHKARDINQDRLDRVNKELDRLEKENVALTDERVSNLMADKDQLLREKLDIQDMIDSRENPPEPSDMEDVHSKIQKMNSPQSDFSYHEPKEPVEIPEEEKSANDYLEQERTKFNARKNEMIPEVKELADAEDIRQKNKGTRKFFNAIEACLRRGG
jgi:hypothetical protein